MSWEIGKQKASPQRVSGIRLQYPENILPLPGSRERPRNTQRRDSDRALADMVRRDAGRADVGWCAGRGLCATQQSRRRRTEASPLTVTKASRDRPTVTRPCSSLERQSPRLLAPFFPFCHWT